MTARILSRTDWTTDYADGSSVILNPGSGKWEVYRGPSPQPHSREATREAAEQAASAKV